jgi:predicted nucleic acid-binding protein
LSGLALLDTSVWSRLRDGRITGDAATALVDRVERGEACVTEPLLLELRYSARDARDFALLSARLDALPCLSLDAAALALALDAQAQLAASPGVSHRVKPIDLLVAGVASRHGVGVVHYDADYDTIADHTDLVFESVWAVERGSGG